MAHTECPRCRWRLGYHDNGVVAGVACPRCGSISRVRPFGAQVVAGEHQWLSPRMMVGAGVAAAATLVMVLVAVMWRPAETADPAPPAAAPKASPSPAPAAKQKPPANPPGGFFRPPASRP